MHGGHKSEAHHLIAQIRLDLKPLEQGILDNRYLRAVAKGSLAADQFKIFAGQQYHIISSDLRSIAMLVSRHGTLPSRGFLISVLEGEAAALDALQAFAAPLGLNRTDLESFEPIPAAHAYCAFMAWLALYGSDAELAGALLVNFPAWGANCGQMRRALQLNYGFGEPALVFFELFANLPPFEDAALSAIQNGMDRGISARLIHRAARMLQAYELMYWDAMADDAKIDLVPEIAPT